MSEHPVSHDPRVAAVVGAATAVSGIDHTWLQVLPPYISMAASVIGLMLSVVLLRNHLLARKKLKIEIEILRERHPQLFE